MNRLYNRLNFTVKSLNALPSVNKRTRFYDTKVEGLVARKLPSGKVVIGVYRRFNDKPIDYDICKLSDDMTMEWIRNQAREIIGKIAKGIDPREEKRQRKQSAVPVEVLTFKLLGEEYVSFLKSEHEKNRKSKSAFINAASTFKNHVYPLYGNKLAVEINRKDFRKVFYDTKTPAVFNKIVIFSKAALNIAVENGRIPNNPLSDLKKQDIENGRKRVLEPHEMNAFLESLSQEKQIYQDVIWVLMLTGARKSNVLAMQWDEINLPSQKWKLMVKGGKSHTIHLSTQVCEILSRRFESRTSSYVFPSELSQTGHISEKSSKGSFWRRVTERAGLYTGDRKYNLTIHDLRRSLATLLLNDGVNIVIIKELLGHSDISITVKSYAHADAEKVNQAVQYASDKYTDFLRSLKL
ncbi:tyrosine-type recombinase/integrase [Shewanella halifaxensis]|uniref:tyrosine-type recombinase/integrase n=1 Tax=Shewanella halifaxensis TaxID=271098 RepID=UPI000D593D9C|nr:site-specific integrase [Shewanella halifaxensis]